MLRWSATDSEGTALEMPHRAAHHARAQAEAEGLPVPQAEPLPKQQLQHELQRLHGPPPLTRAAVRLVPHE